MIAALILAAAAQFGDLSMRVVGPAVAGGRLAGVAGTPQNDKLYYLGTAGGGVWKSANGGATWSPVFDQQDVSAIGAVAIDPKNQDVVWVGTGEANPRNDVSYGDGLYKTTDGAKHWTRVGLEGVWSISRIAVDPKDPNHVVVAGFGDPFKDSSDRGVYVTFDGGKTWNKSLYVDEKTGASDLAMDPKNPNVVYAGMWTFRRVPWTFTSGSDAGGLYKSTDGGKTWNKLTGNGLPAGMTGRIGLAIAASDPKRVYAVIEAKGGVLWRSDDAGAHWKMVSDDSIVDQRPFYFSHIEVNPKNPDDVFAISNDMAESKDGGKKFEQIAKPVHVDFHAMWIASNDSDRMIVGADGGYAITLDGGKNWSFSQNLPIGQIYHVGYSVGNNPYSICAALQDNEGFCGPSNSLSSDGILNSDWYNVVGGDGTWAWPDPSEPALHLGLCAGRRDLSQRRQDAVRDLGASVGCYGWPVRLTRCKVSLQLGCASQLRTVGSACGMARRRRRLPKHRSRFALDGHQPGFSPATSRITSVPRAARSRRTFRAQSIPITCSTSRARR